MDDGAGSDPGQRDDPDAANGSEAGSGSRPGCGHDASAGSSHARPDLRQVARDWIELWESELSAMAVDREAREAWGALMPLWTSASLMGAAWAGSMKAGMGQPPANQPASGDAPDRRARAEPAARTTPPAAAPDARDDEIERLTRHVTELEARLATVERGRGSAAGGGRKRKR